MLLGVRFGPSFLWFGSAAVYPPFLLFVEVRHSFHDREVGPSWCWVLPSWRGRLAFLLGVAVWACLVGRGAEVREREFGGVGELIACELLPDR